MAFGTCYKHYIFVCVELMCVYKSYLCELTLLSAWEGFFDCLDSFLISVLCDNSVPVLPLFAWSVFLTCLYS